MDLKKKSEQIINGRLLVPRQHRWGLLRLLLEALYAREWARNSGQGVRTHGVILPMGQEPHPVWLGALTMNGTF
jgi:hypothetical protein